MGERWSRLADLRLDSDLRCTSHVHPVGPENIVYTGCSQTGQSFHRLGSLRTGLFALPAWGPEQAEMSVQRLEVTDFGGRRLFSPPVPCQLGQKECH